MARAKSTEGARCSFWRGVFFFVGAHGTVNSREFVCNCYREQATAHLWAQTRGTAKPYSLYNRSIPVPPFLFLQSPSPPPPLHFSPLGLSVHGQPCVPARPARAAARPRSTRGRIPLHLRGPVRPRPSTALTSTSSSSCAARLPSPRSRSS